MVKTKTKAKAKAKAPPTTSSASACASKGDWGWNKLPAELQQMIADCAFPKELRIQVHWFNPKGVHGDVEKKMAIEIQNKAEWSSMLRFQRIKELNDDYLQPAIAKKEIVLHLDIAGHKKMCQAWYLTRHAENAPPLRHCVLDWNALLKKFPFKRVVTTLPYLLLDENRHSWDGLKELHYFRLTFNNNGAYASPIANEEGRPTKWKRVAMVSKRGSDSLFPAEWVEKFHAHMKEAIATDRTPNFYLHTGLRETVLEIVQSTLNNLHIKEAGDWFDAVRVSRGGQIQFGKLNEAVKLKDVEWDET